MSIEKKYELEMRIGFESGVRSTEDLEKILQIKPDHIVKKGIPPRIGATAPKINLISMKSGVEKINSTMKDQINGLKAKLGDHKRFNNLPDDISIFISCVAYGYEYVPDLSLSHEEIKFISEMETGYGVVVYDLTSAKAEE
jgi:hypothetical protein